MMMETSPLGCSYILAGLYRALRASSIVGARSSVTKILIVRRCEVLDPTCSAPWSGFMAPKPSRFATMFK